MTSYIRVFTCSVTLLFVLAINASLRQILRQSTGNRKYIYRYKYKHCILIYLYIIVDCSLDNFDLCSLNLVINVTASTGARSIAEMMGPICESMNNLRDVPVYMCVTTRSWQLGLRFLYHGLKTIPGHWN